MMGQSGELSWHWNGAGHGSCCPAEKLLDEPDAERFEVPAGCEILIIAPGLQPTSLRFTWKNAGETADQTYEQIIGEKAYVIPEGGAQPGKQIIRLIPRR